MFSGIIQAIGLVEKIDNNPTNTQIVFNSGQLDMSNIILGDSIAVNGVCLTVINQNKNTFSADISLETSKVSTFSDIKIGQRVNLEKALTLNQSINGHLVSGHIDGVAVVKTVKQQGEHCYIEISSPKSLTHYIVKKGSICINGVSLTVNEVKNDIFTLNIVPYTLKSTTLSELKKKVKVNIEVDIFARHLEQLLKAQA